MKWSERRDAIAHEEYTSFSALVACGAMNERDQDIVVPGFCEVIVSTLLYRSHDRRHISHSREHDYRRSRMFTAEVRQRLAAIHTGHDEIEEHNVDGARS